jgi:hypothetical protein
MIEQDNFLVCCKKYICGVVNDSSARMKTEVGETGGWV